MVTAKVERRLAAILAADVVGYSRLMERDEAGTFARLKAVRKEVVEPVLERHGGRFVDLKGDGAIVEFQSAVAAVEAAVEIQRAMLGRDADLPEGERVRYRIGINLGEVIVDGGTIYGDGVNVAARIEALCEPGGVWLSRRVYDQVRGKLDLALVPSGLHRVKNISEAIETFRVALDGVVPASPAPVARIMIARASRRLPVAAAAVLALALAAAAALGVWRVGGGDLAASWWAGAAPGSPQPSLAVMPLANRSGDPALDYFSDGLTEDLTTQLAGFPELGVVARNSAFAYKGEAVDVKRVGRELGVRFVLEGSVRRTGDRVRITAQLIDAATGRHVWADRFDEEGADVFALQDRVVQKVAAAVVGEHGRIRAAGYRQAWEKPDADLAEYDYFLRVHSLIYRFTRDGMEEARRVAREGLARFPGSALIRIKLGWVDLQLVRFGWSDDTARDLGEAYRLGEEAMRAENLPALARLHGHWLMAMLHGRHTHDVPRVEAEAEAAIGLAPGDTEVRAVLAEPYALAGLGGKAVALIEGALDADPALGAAPWPRPLLALAHFANRQYAEAITAGGGVPLISAASQAALGRMDEARAAVADALAREPGLTLAAVRQRYPFRDPADLDRLLGGLREAGMPGPAEGGSESVGRP